jgi:DNA replication protein DnaC
MTSLQGVKQMNDTIQQRASRLKLYSVGANWSEIYRDKALYDCVERLIEWEEKERQRRKLETYIRKAQTKDFEPIADFDWNWPKKADSEQILDLMDMHFLNNGENIVIVGPSGVGKTTIAKNVVFAAAQRGFHSLFVESSTMLEDLVKHKDGFGLEKAMKPYAKPRLLAIDEVGYLSYNSQHADLLFQLIHRRCQSRYSTLITTNRPFQEWGDVFPHASSVTALVDRLVERCEVVIIDGESYRAHRFHRNQEAKQMQRRKKRQESSGTSQKNEEPDQKKSEPRMAKQ